MINSRYPDQKIIYRKDGSWSFRYFQEEIEGRNPISLFTNKSLIACLKDQIPIGVAIQIKEKPGTCYKILGIANVLEFKEGFFQINGYSDDGFLINESYYGSFSKELDEIDPEVTYDPQSQEDARAKVLRQIVLRQGQKKFRNQLLKVYNSTCLITGCNMPSVLEAAHITAYLGPDTNHLTNGLILRSDIHVLWDLGLIAIEPNEMKVYINQILIGSEYEQYNEKIINLNLKEDYFPSNKALESQWNIFLNKNQN
jgi:putative restriction endonuclease